MSEDQRRTLETQLWSIANLLRGKISDDDYRDYILGHIFYKYLSEKQYLYANALLEGEIVADYKLVALKQRASTAQRVTDRILEFVETFISGIAGGGYKVTY